jgi:hypothetical protein
MDNIKNTIKSLNFGKYKIIILLTYFILISNMAYSLLTSSLLSDSTKKYNYSISLEIGKCDFYYIGDYKYCSDMILSFDFHISENITISPSIINIFYHNQLVQIVFL